MKRYAQEEPQYEYPVRSPRDTIAELLMQRGDQGGINTFGGSDITQPLSQEQAQWQAEADAEEQRNRALLVRNLMSG